jgi:hypothetical protein
MHNPAKVLIMRDLYIYAALRTPSGCRRWHINCQRDNVGRDAMLVLNDKTTASGHLFTLAKFENLGSVSIASIQQRAHQLIWLCQACRAHTMCTTAALKTT